MAFKTLKHSYTTALDYQIHQQLNGGNMGGFHLLNRRFKYSEKLFRNDLYAHYGCVNAIEFSNDGQWMISGGDDKRVLIWNMSKTLNSSSSSYQPNSMKSEHNSNIFCLAFNKSHNKLLSAGNDEQVILHDISTRDSLDVFLHQESVYGLSADPQDDNLFATSCDDGRVLIWDIRQSTGDPFVLANNSSAYHAVMHNPAEPRFLATANAKEGVCLWDLRKPKTYIRKYGPTLLTPSAMSVRFNSAGTQLLALRRRLPPVLYDVVSSQEIAEFDHQEYYNSCTMKSCCFAGERDQYVLSGSDDFKLYVWAVPNSCFKKRSYVKKAHFILRGHRSIVNQVRYNNTYGIIASSGVEKIIKVWSSFPLKHSEDDDNDHLRKVYSHEEYINLILHSGQFMTHDYSHRSTREDPRMMAFFDSLVQRDIEGWTSDSNDAATKNSNSNSGLCFEVQSSEDTTSSSSTSSEDELESIAQMNRKKIVFDRDTNQMRVQTGHADENESSVTSSLSAVPSTNHQENNLVGDRQDSPRNALSAELDTSQTFSNREGNINRTGETGATRRLFSGVESTVSSRLLTNTEGVTNMFFSDREGATNRLFANRQEAAGFIINSRQLTAISSFLNTENDGEEFNPSSDRISQLIAQKRRVHRLKMARKSMKKDKVILLGENERIEGSSKGGPFNKFPSKGSVIGFKPLSLDALTSGGNSIKDKRKFLRKKRAKLSRTPNLDDSSTDSDIEIIGGKPALTDCVDNTSSITNLPNENKRKSEDEVISNNINDLFFKRCRNFKKVSDLTKERLASFQNLSNGSANFQKDLSNTDGNSLCKGEDSNDVTMIPSCSGITARKSSDSQEIVYQGTPVESYGNMCLNKANSDCDDIDIIKNNSDISGPNNSLKESLSVDSSTSDNAPTAVESSNSFCFPLSNGKLNRNYRKRSLEDSNDD